MESYGTAQVSFLGSTPNGKATTQLSRHIPLKALRQEWGDEMSVLIPITGKSNKA